MDNVDTTKSSVSRLRVYSQHIFRVFITLGSKPAVSTLGSLLWPSGTFVICSHREQTNNIGIRQWTVTSVYVCLRDKQTAHTHTHLRRQILSCHLEEKQRRY